jgi:hypothetical protein
VSLQRPAVAEDETTLRSHQYAFLVGQQCSAWNETDLLGIATLFGSGKLVGDKIGNRFVPHKQNVLTDERDILKEAQPTAGNDLFFQKGRGSVTG